MYRIAFISLLAFFTHTSQAQFSKEVKELDSFIKEGIELWKVPGLAVTVVKDGKVVLQKGYGVTDVETKEPVNTKTMFANGSTTKAFVAFGLALLVDEGKLNWYDKVIDHLPYFRLSDPYVTQEATVKDLLTHNIGLGNTDYLWLLDSLSAEETVGRMGDVDLIYGMRDNFIYQNIMYVAAGEVIKAVSGKEWHQYLNEKVWTPLEMDRTIGLHQALQNMQNYVSAHTSLDGAVEKVPFMYSDGISAAGMMWSSIEDMSKWMKFLLDSTKVDGERMLSDYQYQMLFAPQAIVPSYSFYPTSALTKPNWTTYGLGWFQHDYKGAMVNFHTGSLAGLISIAGILPEHNTAVFVAGNLDHAELRHAIMYKAFDLFSLGGDRDWNQEIYDLYKSMESESEKRRVEKASRQMDDTKPSLSLEKFTGTFYHPTYGQIESTYDNSRIYLLINEKEKLELDHYHYNTFKSNSEKYWLDGGLVTYQLNEDGQVKSLGFGNIIFMLQSR